ncbi:O-methyltransferase hmp5 [Lachnellula suecica]|uniref:O-methyltransferase hmp5 n=1 Tax=Lachnellula suecica TaxID=602035 RepID=A0A8T9CDV9_9HELO|nr:O-methyltransferase hmp5 [Lachnellula suecica]
MSAKSRLIADIESLLAAANSSDVDDLDYATRVAMLGKVESIQHQLDDPVLAMYRHLSNVRAYNLSYNLNGIQINLVIQANQTAALRTCVNCGYLVRVALIDNLGRLMRQLSSTGILRSLGENEYAHTKFSLAYIDRSEVDFFNLVMDEIAPVAYRLPEYIAAHEPDAILDAYQSPFSWANEREGKNFYEVLLEQPDRLAKFNSGMMTQEAQNRILGLFPFTNFAENIDKNGPLRPFIVDVAGGRGQSLVAIKGELDGVDTQNLGRWILQERQGVLDSIPDDELPGIEKMAIDFFEPQPLKGAHIYYLRRILHNWHDEPAKLILKNIADAMLPDSILLIGEMVFPEQAGVNKYIYMMDICMLIIGGKERTGNDFSRLLDAVGLRLVKVSVSDAGDQAVIECRLK